MEGPKEYTFLIQHLKQTEREPHIKYVKIQFKTFKWFALVHINGGFSETHLKYREPFFRGGII